MASIFFIKTIIIRNNIKIKHKQKGRKLFVIKIIKLFFYKI